jgi:CheY-like chemotaxis protein
MNDAPRILVCDDEPQILRALRVILRDAGYEAVPAAGGEEALDKAAVRPPAAAIVDLMLPDIDGVEVTERLREWSEMPIIVLSAVGEEEEKVRALAAGADDYASARRSWSRAWRRCCAAPGPRRRSRRSSPTGSRSTSPRAPCAATASPCT